MASKELPRCMNCILIEMGEMACYTERCPDCGRIPPGRKKQKPPDLLRKLVGRTLSTKKPTKTPNTAVMMMEAGLRSNKMTLRDCQRPNDFHGFEQYNSGPHVSNYGERFAMNSDHAEICRTFRDDSID